MLSRLVAAAVYLAAQHPWLCLGAGIACCLLSAVCFELLLSDRAVGRRQVSMQPAAPAEPQEKRWRRAA
jgi:hypothetical protein